MMLHPLNFQTKKTTFELIKDLEHSQWKAHALSDSKNNFIIK